MFTYDWFSNNIASWTTLLAEFKGKPNLKFIEIGCYEGRATRWLLDNILTHDSAIIDVIDTFEGSMEHEGGMVEHLYEKFLANIPEVETKVLVYTGRSQEILGERFFPNFYDFVYVDGSHIAKDVLMDGMLAWPLLKKGGIMIFDDYKWDKYPQENLNPKMAIDAFLSLYKGEYEELLHDYQVAIKKI